MLQDVPSFLALKASLSGLVWFWSPLCLSTVLDFHFTVSARSGTSRPGSGSGDFFPPRPLFFPPPLLFPLPSITLEVSASSWRSLKSHSEVRQVLEEADSPIMPLSPLPLFSLLPLPLDVLSSKPSSKLFLSHSSDCSFRWVTTAGLFLIVDELFSKRPLDLFSFIGDSVLNSSSRQSQIWLPLKTPDFSAENSILGHDTSSPGLCFSVSLLIVTAMKALFLDTSAVGNQDSLIEDILER